MNSMAPSLKRALFGVLGAAVVTAAVAAQTPQTSQAPPRAATVQDRVDLDEDEQPITVTGCLKEEADVPGLEPNIAERAGILEDFILTNARVSAAESAQSSSAGRTQGRQGQASTSAAVMYQIEGLDDEELRRHANQQVEVRGKVDTENLRGASTPAAAGADASQRDLPEIEAESIRMIAASCAPN